MVASAVDIRRGDVVEGVVITAVIVVPIQARVSDLGSGLGLSL